MEIEQNRLQDALARQLFRSSISLSNFDRFWLRFGAILAPQMELRPPGPKPPGPAWIEKNAKKCLINKGHGPRRRSRSSWGGPGAILRGSWGGPGGSGAAPGGISEAFWGAKIGANSESAIRSDNKQRSEARAAERNTESQNKL